LCYIWPPNISAARRRRVEAKGAMNDSHTRQAVILLFLLTAGTIAGAWGFQILGGYLPCPLCLKQRAIYYAVVPLLAGLLWLILAYPAQARLVRRGLLLVGLVMLASTFLAGYHAGVEWKWWPGPDACAFGAGLSGGVPDLGSAKVVSCSEAQWRFLGLSFAGWNVVLSLIATGIALWGARRPLSSHGSSTVSQ
jgi:disulfide bond formation protein DsbB